MSTEPLFPIFGVKTEKLEETVPQFATFSSFAAPPPEPAPPPKKKPQAVDYFDKEDLEPPVPEESQTHLGSPPRHNQRDYSPPRKTRDYPLRDSPRRGYSSPRRNRDYSPLPRSRESPDRHRKSELKSENVKSEKKRYRYSSESSSSDSSRHERRHKHRKSKKSRSDSKPKKSKSALGDIDIHFGRSGSSIWATPGQTTSFYFDESGEKDHIRYGHIHIPDIPVYTKPTNACIGVDPSRSIRWGKPKTTFSYREAKVEKKPLRYFRGVLPERVKMESKEEDKKKKESKQDTEDIMWLDVSEESEEETTQSYFERRSKWFNEETRKDRSNVKCWLEFITFQDEISAGEVNKGPILERKISIFEKALEANPNSEDLIVGHLNCCEQLYEPEKTKQLWEKAVMGHPDSARLWARYIEFSLSNFASFSMSSLRLVFSGAIRILNNQKKFYKPEYPKYKALEYRSLMIVMAMCWVERQAGYTERGTSIFQAMLEANFCAPKKLNPETPRDVFLDFFQTFWEAEAPRFGENESFGWNAWFQEMEASVTAKRAAVVPDYDPMVGTASYEEARAQEDQELLKVYEQEKVRAQPVEEPETIEMQQEESEDSEDLRENLSHLNKLREWFQKEQKESEAHWLPLRDISGEQDFDPERVVFYHDIRDFIFRLSDDTLKAELIFMFLQYLGLNLPPRFSSSSPHAMEIWERVQDYQKVVNSLKEIIDAKDFRDGVYYVDTKQKIDLSVWQNLSLDKLEDKQQIQIIRNVLQKSKQIYKSNANLHTQFSILLMMFESVHGKLELSRSLAKTMLQSDSMNLELWASYAMIERMNGNTREARRVYIKSLSLSAQLPATVKIGLPLIVKAFAEMELQDKDNNSDWEATILNILLSLVEDGFTALTSRKKKDSQVAEKPKTVVPEDRITTGRKNFGQQMEQRAATMTNLNTFTEFVYCYALFDYLSTHQLASANAIFEKGKKMLQLIKLHQDKGTNYFKEIGVPADIHLEKLNISWVSLTLFHHDKPDTPPRLLRVRLEALMKENPLNLPMILVFIDSEKKSTIYGRTRTYFDCQLCSKYDSSLPWLASIFSEKKIGKNQRLKSLFESAIREGTATARSPCLWLLYIQFEVQRKNLEGAKNVFYRAIRAVPWFKTVWLESINSLANCFDVAELSDILNLMAEKELRLRIELPF